jgi:hypothetical protein
MITLTVNVAVAIVWLRSQTARHAFVFLRRRGLMLSRCHARLRR